MVCKVEHEKGTDFHVLLSYEKKLDITNPKFFDLEFYGVVYNPIIKPTGLIKKLMLKLGKYGHYIISGNLKAL